MQSKLSKYAAIFYYLFKKHIKYIINYYYTDKNLKIR